MDPLISSMDQPWWHKTLGCKPDFEQCMRRIYAWFNQAVIDRPPIQFSPPNSEYRTARLLEGRSWPDLKARWFDAEFQVESFRESLRGRQFLAETFPVFWPNLGPEVFSAFHGGDLIFGESTSYYVPFVKEWEDARRLKLDFTNPYFVKLEEMTLLALEACGDEFLVGYSDFHAGVDCAAAWRDPQQFCLDLLQYPAEAHDLIRKASAGFLTVYDHFDALLKKHGQLSVTWMGIPSFGRLHIPSCDFAALLSREHFIEFCLPVTQAEVKHMTHNIFHVDGKGVAKNLDLLLEIPEICAFQYVQGAGSDQPILQWLTDLRTILRAGKSLVLYVQPDELEPLIGALRPEGLFLCMEVEETLQPEVIKRVERW